MRTAKLTIILGANGTGKTTLLRKVITAVDQRVLIVTPDDIEWGQYPDTSLTTASDFKFKGVRRHVFNSATTLDRLHYFQNGILVFDDCRS